MLILKTKSEQKQNLIRGKDMSTHSFICNACVYYNVDTDEELNQEKCKNCNGQGKEWQPRNKEKYKKDPHGFIKNLILVSQ